ncbi:hypothetical protein HH212_07310 [Massilia forsythiae]|uniref:Uncharacterized protein n=1 Tax=Massilia forsythiae TaxID=2728020 RepID=A0A7Z2VVG4_9BURK|nr:hypothetical protein [Massilia forsythiae]QJD99852.1 hypothetical protein HH212_07310 [Massilia forsythiae]
MWPIQADHDRENDMGWIISVGKAGVPGRTAGTRLLSVDADVRGVSVRVQVFANDDPSASHGETALTARQAQRVWRTILSTLVEPN